ncbi:6-bladed beta-propeller [Parabacteroides sp. AM08-6]|uniref:6-bladed beta-propeller n=1 Tax=Parabacteroides sp. AM08-6 TaxID=2292053 RepID=UPI000F004842|nr:6-bladed beta-propeller [Parabacteroides sp. AM08-6]RHJ85460.1 6-bladed beta-propeller [Parabacteroides sp. AM08-6]
MRQLYHIIILSTFYSFAWGQVKYEIDINKAEVKNNIPMSIVFKSMKIIPLETNENSLIARINKIEIYNNWIFVIDNFKANTLHIFDKEGNYIKQIGRKGSDPGEYKQLSTFTIDKQNKHVYLLDNYLHKIFIYDFIQNKCVKEISIKNHQYESFHMQYIDGFLYTDVYSYNPQIKKTPLIQKIDCESGNIIKAFYDSSFNMDYVNRNEIESFAFYPIANNNFCFAQRFMNTILLIDQKNISPYFSFRHPNFVKKEEMEDAASKAYNSPKRSSIYITLKKGVYSINEIFETNKHISFSYIMNRNVIRTILYDKTNNKTIDFDFF